MMGVGEIDDVDRADPGLLERDMIVERTRAGLEAARRRGVQLGRPRVVDDQMRARIERLRRCGRSYSEIAEVTGISRTTVIRAAKQAAKVVVGS